MFSVLIIAPNEVVFDGEASSVILPGETGEFEVLEFHHDIISLLREGSIFIDHIPYPIKKGVAKFSKDRLIALIER